MKIIIINVERMTRVRDSGTTYSLRCTTVRPNGLYDNALESEQHYFSVSLNEQALIKEIQQHYDETDVVVLGDWFEGWSQDDSELKNSSSYLSDSIPFSPPASVEVSKGLKLDNKTLTALAEYSKLLSSLKFDSIETAQLHRRF